MSSPLTDFTKCDLEPIHIPGKIQGHVLLVTDKYDVIKFMSANSVNFIDKEPSALLGKPINEFENSWVANFPKVRIPYL